MKSGLEMEQFSFIIKQYNVAEDFPGGASGKGPTCQCRLDSGSIPGSGRSLEDGTATYSSILA